MTLARSLDTIAQQLESRRSTTAALGHEAPRATFSCGKATQLVKKRLSSNTLEKRGVALAARTLATEACTMHRAYSAVSIFDTEE
jgi:hypothetical protein